MQNFQAFPAPAKINLFLHVTGQRDDGYHLLQTAFRLLDFGDTLHIRLRQDGQIKRMSSLDGVAEADDLCVRAAQILQQHSNTHLGADIQLEKRIPMGGGLGGGSSDAATVLLALNQLWQLGLDRETLQTLGLKLGADVPVFIFGKNAWAEGIGEKLQEISCNSSHYLILTPKVNAETAKIFSHKELTRNTNPTTIAAFSRCVTSGELYGGDEFHNDLEPIATLLYPEIKDTLSWLSQFSKAKMSGSGASVFAEFTDKSEAMRVLALKPEKYFGVVTTGISQHPLYNYAA